LCVLAQIVRRHAATHWLESSSRDVACYVSLHFQNFFSANDSR
jgi:hypothetical protein